MIEIDAVKRYDKKTAFDGKLDVSQNECVGVIGNNGAGKTTMLRLILDLVKATSGHVMLKNIDVSRSDHWNKYTGSFLDASFLIPFLTPREYIDFVGQLHQLTKEGIESFLKLNLDFFEPSLFEEKKRIQSLSKGNQNKVGILAALIGNPEILILDEPFANLDPRSQSWLKRKLKSLHQEGVTLIVSSHDLSHITEISSRTILLENGKIISDKSTNSETLTELESYFSLEEAQELDNSY